LYGSETVTLVNLFLRNFDIFGGIYEKVQCDENKLLPRIDCERIVALKGGELRPLLAATPTGRLAPSLSLLVERLEVTHPGAQTHVLAVQLACHSFLYFSALADNHRSTGEYFPASIVITNGARRYNPGSAGGIFLR
jgi:hypothetical protein